MRTARTPLTIALLLGWAGVCAAAPAIGVVGPMSGPSAILGGQLRAGALAAAGTETELAIEDDACTADGGRAAAERLVAAQVKIVVGFLCTESIEAAMPAFSAAGIPVVTLGVRTDSLTDRRQKTKWPVYRLAPRADGERAAVASILTELWRTELFAIVDDGTISARELAESLRLAAEQAALQPVLVDTYRPQLDNQIGLIGRLRRTEATRLFAAGDRDDLAIMGRDAARQGVDLVIAGGESLRAAPGDVELATGTLMVGLPEWADIADPAAVAAVTTAGAHAEGYTLPAYAAIEVAVAALASGKPVAEALDTTEFRTALGPVRFDAKGDLTPSPYGLFRFDGKAFQPVTVD